jgi:hypothetical protein
MDGEERNGRKAVKVKGAEDMTSCFWLVTSSVGSHKTCFWLVISAVGSHKTCFWLVTSAVGSHKTCFWLVTSSVGSHKTCFWREAFLLHLLRSEINFAYRTEMLSERGRY